MNDDQLTRDLHDAFHAATDDLRYAGPTPRLRRSPVAAISVTAVAAGVALVALGPTIGGAGSAVGHTHAAATQAPTTSPDAHPFSVDRVSYAGTTVYVVRQVAVQARLVARDVATLPADADPVDTGTDTKAWFGTEPVTGDPALFVQPPEGGLFSLSGAGWTREELSVILRSDPTTVPKVD